jgi:DeoR/GlpR family transcriptional regulator of sugar metabolism
MYPQMKSERLRQIRQHIEENGHATVNELSTLFNVSPATIRRDLEEMDSLGWIHRDHGGAVRIDSWMIESPVLKRMSAQAEEKRRIGQAAATLVNPGETIFIGSGTTTLEVVRHLHVAESLTVITNALNIANELVSDSRITLIVMGGLVRNSELSLIGHITEQALRELRADKVFLGIRAVSIRDGLTSNYLPEIMTDRGILQIAPEIILVADHTKLGKASTSHVAPISAIHTLVTDSQAPQPFVKALEALGIRVILA